MTFNVKVGSAWNQVGLARRAATRASSMTFDGQSWTRFSGTGKTMSVVSSSIPTSKGIVFNAASGSFTIPAWVESVTFHMRVVWATSAGAANLSIGYGWEAKDTYTDSDVSIVSRSILNSNPPAAFAPVQEVSAYIPNPPAFFVPMIRSGTSGTVSIQGAHVGVVSQDLIRWLEPAS
jgi:hypothetical protein